jgi:hypothetical protein
MHCSATSPALCKSTLYVLSSWHTMRETNPGHPCSLLLFELDVSVGGSKYSTNLKNPASWRQNSVSQMCLGQGTQSLMISNAS